MKELSERDKALLVDGIPESNLVLFCPGLQGRGSTLIDRSTYANNGTISGATWTRLPSGLWTLSFDKVDDYVQVTDAASIQNMAAFTLEVWLYPISTGENNGGRIFDKAIGKLNFLLYPTLSIELIRARATTNCDVYKGSALIASTWQHLLASFDGTTALICKNGVSLAPLSGSVGVGAFSTDAGDLYIGNNSTQTRTWDGYMAMWRIYDAAKTAAFALAHYNRERTWFGV